MGFTKIANDRVDAILDEFGSVDEFIYRVLGGPEGGTGTGRGFAPVTEQEMEELEDAQGLDRAEIDRQMAAIRKRLSQPPRLKEQRGRQRRQTSTNPRSAAFELEVKRLYGSQCAICGSALRSPAGKPEVHSAHIYPRGEDGRDDPRNGICLCRRHHWAFDVGWIALADDHTVLVRDNLPADETYSFIREFAGRRLRPPALEDAAPHQMFLREHRRLTGFE